MNIINKWKEYDDGKLIAPAVVQYDTIRDEHLIWVWDGDNIKQFSRTSFDEKSILADAMAVIDEPVYVDPKDTSIEELKTQVVTLKAEKAVLISEKAILISEKEALVKEAEIIKVVK